MTWTALPPVGVSEYADLPDATGVTFTSELFIDFFEPGQVLEDCSDFLSLTANIEHSYLGDLSMWVTCPDGTDVVLMESPYGGLVSFDCSDGMNGFLSGEPISVNPLMAMWGILKLGWAMITLGPRKESTSSMMEPIQMFQGTPFNLERICHAAISANLKAAHSMAFGNSM